jgi:hypothetical protein
MLLAEYSPSDVQATIAVTGAFAVPVIAIIAGVLGSITKTRAREATKRELAAYIAEGSMRPEDAERILRSDMKKWER